MSTVQLTPIRLFEGVWEAVIDGAGEKPDLLITHQEVELSGTSLEAGEHPGRWVLRVPVPVQSLKDGVQTYLVQLRESGETIGSFSIIAGEALGEDIRAEVELLRAELDMLKKAFRRHCLETM